jgi:hypothetical protein
MTADYAEPDRELVDYQLYCLDPRVRDRQTQAPLLLRGPVPATLAPHQYFTCIGAAQTFGRFCEKPFPTLLQQRLGMPVLNLGRGGAGPSFFSEENENLLDYINNARFAVVQIMAGRSESNSLFESKGLGHYIRRADGASIGCDQAFSGLLAGGDIAQVKKIVAETRHNWVINMTALLRAIKVPKILLWLSERRPAYREGYGEVSALFGKFPQLVNASMVRRIRAYADGYVECVSALGMPQPLIHRVTGAPLTITDPWGSWSNNWYYPSPQMHDAAAAALEPACRRYVEPAVRRRRPLLRNAWHRAVQLKAAIWQAPDKRAE